MNNMKKALQGVEVSKVNIYPDSQRATHKKVLDGKTSGYDGIHGFWFKKFTSIVSATE